jgi:ubiquitin-protein ligase
MSEPKATRVFVEGPDGERFEAMIPRDTMLSDLAADFFEDRGWPTRDGHGRGHRAVVELVDPENPDRTKRLGGEQTVDDAALWDGAVLRVFPESIAGTMDERERARALVADHQDMLDLAAWNRQVRFETNTTYAPTRYTVTLAYPGFRGLQRDGRTPLVADEHQLEIVLPAQYPRRAPVVRWLTPIFHPNIHPEHGGVCLGVLMDRYLPGLGLARVVTMLTEMVQWRNFDMTQPLNGAAAEWAADTDHWDHIYGIGGSPFQGPIEELFREWERRYGGVEARPRVRFTRVNAG